MMWWLLGLLAGGGALALATRAPSDTGARLDAKKTAASAVKKQRGTAVHAPADDGGARFKPINPVPTAPELAELALEAIYIGPLDEPDVRGDLRNIALTDTADRRYQAMSIARDAVSMGIDGNPKKVPPNPDGNAVEAWNYKQLLLLEAIVDWWSSPITAPKRHNVRLMNRDLLAWANEMLAFPRADVPIYGKWIDGIYQRNKVAKRGERVRAYETLFRNALKRWAADVNVIYREIPPNRWAFDVPSWGDESDQAALRGYLAKELYAVGVDKMIIWPGGPPSDPRDDAATQVAIVIAVIVIAAATGVGV